MVIRLPRLPANIGIHANILGRWRREQLEKQQDAFPGSGHQSGEAEELSRLREENCQLKMEREILKKAAAYVRHEGM